MGKTIKLHKKVKPKYKYAINEHVAMLPRSTKVSDLVKHLEDSGISRDEFYRDREIAFASDKSIPSDRLFIYAQVFDVPVEDLMNHTIKAKSLRQTNLKLKSPLK